MRGNSEDLPQITAARKERIILSCLLLILLTLGVFWQTTGFEFTNFDDDVLVYDNELVRDGFSLEKLGRAFTTMPAGAWMPLTWLSHMLDCQLFGLDAGRHHLVNLIFHIFNTLLIFQLLQVLTGMAWRSLLVAALFALHPLHVETVAWVADRKDLLCLFFWLLTILVYVAWVRKPDWRLYLLMLVMFAGALMAKAMAVTLPAVLLLLDFWPLQRLALGGAGKIRRERRLLGRLIVEKIPFFGLALVSTVLTSLAEQGIGLFTPQHGYSLGGRVANALVSYVAYLGKTFWPVKLVPFYLYPVQIPFWQWSTALLVLLAITAGCWYGRRLYPYLLFGWLGYLVTLLPVSGLIQLAAIPMADRYTYLPLTFIFIMLVWGLADLAGAWRLRREVLVLPAIVIITILAWASWKQAGHWVNSQVLFEHTLAVEPENYHAAVLLGVHHRDQGAYEEAIAYLNRAITMAPGDHEAFGTLGDLYDRLGRAEEAEYYYQASLRIDPTFTDAYVSLGVLKARQGDLAAAERYLRQSFQYYPDNHEALANLGLVLYLQGRLEEAAEFFLRDVTLVPGAAGSWNGLGLVRMKQGRLDEAASSFRAALLADPGSVNARDNLEKLHSATSPGAGKFEER